VNSDFVPFLNEIFSERLELWLDNNPEDGKTIIEKAVIARKASEAAKKAREAVKNKVVKQDKAFKLPTTLADCWTKDRTKAELLIGEGKSACSGLVAARSAETQAIYGVRGKMLSVLKTTPSKILANQEINNLIQALGLECDQKTAKLKYNKSKLRYGKIIACADAK
jgi:DNA gyrase subunit B